MSTKSGAVFQVTVGDVVAHAWSDVRQPAIEIALTSAHPDHRSAYSLATCRELAALTYTIAAMVEREMAKLGPKFTACVCVDARGAKVAIEVCSGSQVEPAHLLLARVAKEVDRMSGFPGSV